MELNLSEIVWPICLLKCNATLQQMKPGDYLLIIVEDADVVENLIQIITSYSDLCHEVDQRDGTCRIMVRDLRTVEASGLQDNDSPK